MKHLTALADSNDRPAWLEARKSLITATMVSSIVGTNPYTGLIDVWNEKHDPDWSPDRNWRLDERAAYGTEREAAIVTWAADDIGVDLTPNSTLYHDPATNPTHACTPDAYGFDGDDLIVVDAKTTETDWITKGVPQYILDQMLWTWGITGAARIYLAVERTKWTKGAPTILSRHIIPIDLGVGAANRLAFLREQAADFEQMILDGIAPESDIDIRQIDFDTDPDDARLFAETDAALTEIDDIDARIAGDVARRAELVDVVKRNVKEYRGRRVHMIGTRRVAKLVRFWSSKADYKALDPSAVAAVTTWVPADRVVIEANPEWSAE